MMFKLITILLLINRINCESNILNYDLNVSNDIDFIEQYKSGVESYLSNDWKSCIDQIEKSLINYHNYYNTITTCRLECDFLILREKNFFVENLNDLNFYENIVKKTLCMIKCKHKKMTDLFYYIMDNWSREVFLRRKPYEYLQLCYFKNGDITKAASAVYTLLMLNPNNKMMQDNFLFYSKNSEFIVDELIDYEEKDFVKYYVKAIDEYENENWQGTIDNMEKSLLQFIRNEDECRAFCEGEFDHGWYPDFISSIANHFTYSLRCKSNCTRDISTVLGRYNHNFFATHYEYLQIAYFKVNNLEEACKTATSYLLFETDAEDMLENIKFYKSVLNVQEKYFTPRNEAKDYLLRRDYEKKLLNYIDKEFMNEEYFNLFSTENIKTTDVEEDTIKDERLKNITNMDINGNCPAEKLVSIFFDTKGNYEKII